MPWEQQSEQQSKARDDVRQSLVDTQKKKKRPHLEFSSIVCLVVSSNSFLIFDVISSLVLVTS